MSSRVSAIEYSWLKGLAKSCGGNGIERACDASLARLATDHLDLYLLHWPSGITEFSGVVTAFENLGSAGLTRAGVSPTSKSATWNSFSMFPMAIAARPIRSFTISAIAGLNVIYCLGANSTICR